MDNRRIWHIMAMVGGLSATAAIVLMTLSFAVPSPPMFALGAAVAAASAVLLTIAAFTKDGKDWG